MRDLIVIITAVFAIGFGFKQEEATAIPYSKLQEFSGGFQAYYPDCTTWITEYSCDTCQALVDFRYYCGSSGGKSRCVNSLGPYCTKCNGNADPVECGGQVFQFDIDDIACDFIVSVNPGPCPRLRTTPVSLLGCSSICPTTPVDP